MEKLNISSLEMGDYIEHKVSHTPYLVGEDVNNCTKILINLKTGRFIYCDEENIEITNFKKMPYNHEFILTTKSN